MSDTDSFVVVARRLKRGNFSAEPGKGRFLRIPASGAAVPTYAISRKNWARAVLDAGHTHQDPRSGADCGDITVLIHGYNTSADDALALHRRLSRALATGGYSGALVSFDWPSNDLAINYLEDRTDAKLSALRLVDDCIRLLVGARYPGCRINVHVIAYSMGAYVLREAFDDADDRPLLAANNWNVSQICLVAADVSAESLATADSRSRSLYRHCNRLTNYSNAFDRVLKLSNLKRIGVAPRAGRRGLPPGKPAKANNVDCSERFRSEHESSGSSSHSWYFDDEVFIADLVATLAGDDGADVTAARRLAPDGRLLLD